MPLQDLGGVADGAPHEVRGDGERVDGDRCSRGACSGLNRLSGWSLKGGEAAPDCARVSGGGELLEQVAVTLADNGPHLIGQSSEVEDEGMRSWLWEG